MKTTIVTLAAVLALMSCQTEEGKKAESEVAKAEARLKIDQELADLAQEELDYALSMNTGDARAKMILVHGQKKMDWYDSCNNVTHMNRDREDSIERAQLDSVKATMNK